MWRKEDVIKMLKENQGEESLRSYADTVGCSAAYLSAVYTGVREPGNKILNHLGLEKVVTRTYIKKRRWK